MHYSLRISWVIFTEEREIVTLILNEHLGRVVGAALCFELVRRLRGRVRRAREARRTGLVSVAQFWAAIDPLCAVRVAHNWSERGQWPAARSLTRCRENKNLPVRPRFTSAPRVVHEYDKYLAKHNVSFCTRWEIDGKVNRLWLIDNTDY